MTNAIEIKEIRTVNRTFTEVKVEEVQVGEVIQWNWPCPSWLPEEHALPLVPWEVVGVSVFPSLADRKLTLKNVETREVVVTYLLNKGTIMTPSK